MVINIHQAKSQLSRLIQKAVAGEEIVIANAGKPVVRVVPFAAAGNKPRTPGGWQGRVRIAEDFDVLPPQIRSAFRGEDE